MTNNGKVGVAIVRFQVPDLHPGHKYLLDYISERSETLCVILTTMDAVPTDKNPLSFEDRKEMVHELYPNAHVLKVLNCPNDGIWSKRIDKALHEAFGEQEIVLHGSRDSFIPYYNGRYKTEEVPPIESPSGTELRKICTTSDRLSYRIGVINSTLNRYPIVYPAVDCAPYKKMDGTYYILLGHKEGDGEKYRFIGGITDKKDCSYNKTVDRELAEEGGENVLHGTPEYICSCSIDDYRYRGTKDGVMTTFFGMEYYSGIPEAHDDIDSVKWFPLGEIENIIVESHKPLLKELIQFLGQTKWQKIKKQIQSIFKTIFS